MSNFSLCNDVFKSQLLQRLQKASTCEKALIEDFKNLFSTDILIQELYPVWHLHIYRLQICLKKVGKIRRIINCTLNFQINYVLHIWWTKIDVILGIHLVTRALQSKKGHYWIIIKARVMWLSKVMHNVPGNMCTKFHLKMLNVLWVVS